MTANATSGFGPIPQGAVGQNTAVYDGGMNDTAIPGLPKTAGIDAMRYPGGSYAPPAAETSFQAIAAPSSIPA